MERQESQWELVPSMASTLMQTTRRKSACCFSPCACQLAPCMLLCVESSQFFHKAASKSSQDFWNATYWVNWGNGGIILEKNVNKARKKHEEFQLYKVCYLNIWYTTISMHTLIFNMNARKVRVALTALRAIASQYYDRIMTFQRENEHFHVRYSHSDDIQRHAQLYFLIILSQR